MAKLIKDKGIHGRLSAAGIQIFSSTLSFLVFFIQFFPSFSPVQQLVKWMQKVILSVVVVRQRPRGELEEATFKDLPKIRDL